MTLNKEAWLHTIIEPRNLPPEYLLKTRQSNSTEKPRVICTLAELLIKMTTELSWN